MLKRQALTAAELGEDDTDYEDEEEGLGEKVEQTEEGETV
jgi:hypothetical protein